MCLAIPGKVVEMDEEGNCIIDYVAEKREARLFMDDVSIGDFVIVSNKIVVMRVPEDQARDYLKLLGKS